jgi:hypothetical protein
MRKLLLVGTIGLIAVLVLLWREMHAPVDAAPAPQQIATAAAAAPTQAAQAAQALAKVAEAAKVSSDGKVNPNSDDFFYNFVEKGPKVASRAAMSCYAGGLHRRAHDQWITFSFVEHIKDGEVTINKVTVDNSTLNDKELEDCMVAAVGKAHWHDDSLPDTDKYEDSATLNPERGGKKYMPSDHEGPLAPPDTPR